MLTIARRPATNNDSPMNPAPDAPSPDAAPTTSWPLGLLRELILITPAVATIWLAVYELGPWRWLVEIQRALFGAYYPSYTFAACFMLLVLVTALVHFGLAAAGWPARAVLGTLLGHLADFVFSLPNWAGTMIFAGMIALGMGLWFYVPIQLAGPRTEATAEDIEAGKHPASRWLVIRGRLLHQYMVVFSEGDKEKERAMPCVSEGWQPGDPVAVVVVSNDPDRLPRQPGLISAEGVAALRGVPGMTRSSLEAQGLKVAPGATFIDVAETPGGAGIWGIIGLVGLACVVVGVLGGWLFRPRVQAPPRFNSGD